MSLHDISKRLYRVASTRTFSSAWGWAWDKAPILDFSEVSALMSYERLDVYQCSIRFFAIAVVIVKDLPKGHRELSDQIKLVSMSNPLNIAEGAGKRTKPDCRKYFDNARGSAMECGAALDVCSVLELIEKRRIDEAKILLERIVSMLTRLSGS